MGALLVAAGGSIRAGQKLDEVDALDIAPTLLSWLGISPPEWMEGRPIAGLTANPSAAPTTFEETEEAK
jgi:arylsulfatase A-like enzyme